MGLSVGQSLDLWNIEVGVDFGALVFSFGVVPQDTSARLEIRWSRLGFIASFVYGNSRTHGVDKDRRNAGLFEPGLETPQNGFGSPEVVSVSLQTPEHHVMSHWYVIKARNNPKGTYGLENDIKFRGQPLQVCDIVEGPKNGLESQFLKPLSLLGRTKVDGDLVVGPSGVLDEMGEDSASNVTWSTAARVGDKHSAPDNETPQTVRHSTYQWHR